MLQKFCSVLFYFSYYMLFLEGPLKNVNLIIVPCQPLLREKQIYAELEYVKGKQKQSNNLIKQKGSLSHKCP
jgi:hypothetical protein